MLDLHTLEFSALDLVILALAAFRITRFFIEDHLFSPVRERIWKRFPPESTKTGYLFTCPHCMGFWISSLLIFSYILVGAWAVLFCLPFALSAVVSIIFTWLDK